MPVKVLKSVVMSPITGQLPSGKTPKLPAISIFERVKMDIASLSERELRSVAT